MSAKPIAFFDVDKTLCDCYTGFPTTIELMRRKIVKKRRILQAIFYNAVGRPLPALAESALRLELANGSRVVSLPGDEGTVRGFSGVSLLVIDEASRVPDDLYRSVRPMLAVSQGRLVCLSTPFGQRGFFYEYWRAGAEGQVHRIRGVHI